MLRIILVRLGRSTTTPSSVASSSFTSCTLAPLAIIDSGTPRSSTNILLLRPFLSPIRGVRSHAFDGQGRFSCGPIDTLPLPSDALHPVVLGQARLPQFEKESSLVPVLKMLMHDAGRAKNLRYSETRVDVSRGDAFKSTRTPASGDLPCSSSGYRDSGCALKKTGESKKGAYPPSPPPVFP